VFDGGYYVLQVQSLLQGSGLFQDESVLFPFLLWLARWTGDIVLGNELAASVFCGAIVFLGTSTSIRLTGRIWPGIVCGLYLWLSPTLLGISSEFLKNTMGLVCWVFLFWSIAHRRFALGGLVFLLSLWVHKLMAAVGLLLIVSYFFAILQREQKIWIVLLGGLFAVASMFGLLSPNDFERFLVGWESPWERIIRLKALFLWRVEWGFPPNQKPYKIIGRKKSKHRSNSKQPTQQNDPNLLFSL
jgi:hypothetical protein